MQTSAIYIGIRGRVIALDRSTGTQLWCTDLKGADFVNVMLDRDLILATTAGEAFALDAATGRQLWHNPLKGQGVGLATMAAGSGASAAAPPAEKHAQDAAAASAASAT